MIVTYHMDSFPLQWNYPISLFSWKVGPALASGNTCVVKPSELTPLTALHTAALFAEVQHYLRDIFAVFFGILTIKANVNQL